MTRGALRIFGAGAAFGFLAGAFLACAIVWRYGNVVGSREARLAHPPDPPVAVERFAGEGGIDDAGAAVVEGVAAPPVGTSGEPPPVVVPPESPASVSTAPRAAEL